MVSMKRTGTLTSWRWSSGARKVRRGKRKKEEEEEQRSTHSTLRVRDAEKLSYEGEIKSST
jgi:hypothetical protein